MQAGEFLDHIGMASERQNTHHGKRVRELAESLGWQHQQRRTAGGERKLGLWPKVATSATSATGVATGPNASDASASSGVATSATSKSEDQSLKTKKQEQEQAPNALCSFFPVAEVATRPNASDASASGHVATHLPPTCRQPLENRIRELGHSSDLSGWSDEELPELLQSLEAANTRRAAAAVIAIPEAA